MKTDGFGLTHRDDCRTPKWQTKNRKGEQQCKSCGIRWRNGDPAHPARPPYGYNQREDTTT